MCHALTRCWFNWALRIILGLAQLFCFVLLCFCGRKTGRSSDGDRGHTRPQKEGPQQHLASWSLEPHASHLWGSQQKDLTHLSSSAPSSQNSATLPPSILLVLLTESPLPPLSTPDTGVSLFTTQSSHTTGLSGTPVYLRDFLHFSFNVSSSCKLPDFL